MEKLIDKFEYINSKMLSIRGNSARCAEEAKRIVIAFSEYLRVNDYLPQLIETGEIGYVKSFDCYGSSKPATVYSADEVFNQFLEGYE